MTAPDSAEPRRATPSAGAVGSWLTSWRLALRIGAREIRRARGRSALIMVMVGLPVLLIVAVATWSGSTTSRALVPEVFGNGQATVQADPDPGAKRVAGHQPNTPWTSEQIGSLIDGDVIPIASGDIGLQLSDRLHVNAIAMPVSGIRTSGLLKLRSGHWPTAADQMLITKDFAKRHRLDVGARVMASSVHGRPDPTPVQLTVTGIVALPDVSDLHGFVVVGRQDLLSISDPSQLEYLIMRPAPVTAAEVQRLHGYGLDVLSRDLVEHPGSAPDQADGMPYGGGDSSEVAFYVLLGAGLIFESMLLAGPAFAISAARQRHTMGLIASNGAVRAQLRRQLLGQALILGVLAGAVGALAGSLLARYGVVLEARVTGTWAAPAPILVSAMTVAFLGAAVASVVAALLPARGIGRLDLIAALRHRTILTRTSSLGPVIGLIMVVGGLGVALGFGFFGAAEMTPRYLMGAGTAAAFIGAMLTLPWLVTVLGRVAGGFPLAVRLAGRDAARHVGRCVPAMAAVLAASGMFTIMALALASDDRVEQQQYQPSTVRGQGIVYAGSPNAHFTVDVIKGRHPDWSVTAKKVVGHQDAEDVMLGSSVSLVPKRCTADQVVNAANESNDQTAMRCSEASSDNGLIIQVVGDDQESATGLPPDARQALDRGAIVLTSRPTGLDQTDLGFSVRDELINAGKASVVVGTSHGQSYVASKPVPLPAVMINPGQIGEGQFSPDGETIGWITEQTARHTKLPVKVSYWNVAAPGGAISADDEQSINELAPEEAPLYVERGFQSTLRLGGLVLLGVGALLVIIAALVSTALSQVEARPDLATLTAVGAPPALRRRFAAAQAAIIVLVGVVAGQVIGLTAGVAFAASNTREYTGPGQTFGPPVIAVPWEQPLILLGGALLISAGLAVLGAWSSPQLGRRLS